MLDMFRRNWWTFAVQGVAAVIFGILTIIWPGTSLRVMIALFGAFAVVTGVMLAAASFDAARRRLHWGSLLAAGVLGVVVGLVTWFWPGLTALAVLYLVVAWALVTGVLYIVASLEFRDVIQHAWLLTLAGVLSVALAVVLAVDPRSGILSLVWVVGIYAVIGGISALTFAFRLRGQQQSVSSTASRLAHST
ncbi:MAG: hypothetical protein JWO42_4074 [Chloroflexi bacterium]|nr:hypothetical protein [Chloroflexota bacterium]